LQIVVQYVALAGRHIIAANDIVNIVDGLIKPASIVVAPAQLPIELTQVPLSVVDSFQFFSPASEARRTTEIPHRAPDDGAMAAVALSVNRRLLPKAKQQNSDK
jgi:hypothetical protein